MHTARDATGPLPSFFIPIVLEHPSSLHSRGLLPLTSRTRTTTRREGNDLLPPTAQPCFLQIKLALQFMEQILVQTMLTMQGDEMLPFRLQGGSPQAASLHGALPHGAP